MNLPVNNFYVLDGQNLQTPQDAQNFVIMGANATVESVGSDVIFAGAGQSTIYDIGIGHTSHGFAGDTVVLGSGHGTVLEGGINSTIYGGTGTADIFYTANTPGQLVTGSGDLSVVGNKSMAGVTFGGGVKSVDVTASVTTVHTGLGATVHFWGAA